PDRRMPMSQAKQPSKQKRRSKALPVLGAAGLSLSLVGTASAVPGGPAVNLPTSGNGDGNQVFLGEEEISDVSLATFDVFDREGGDGTSSMVELVGRGGGCHGCGGCRHSGGGCHAGGGCGGCHHGCGCHGCGGCRHGCGGRGWGRLWGGRRRLRLRQLWDRLWWLRRVGWLRRVRRRRVVLVARPSHLVRLVKRSFVCSDPASSAFGSA